MTAGGFSLVLGGAMDLLDHETPRYRIRATMRGLDFGNQEAVAAFVEGALLRDGSATYIDRYGNRLAPIVIEVKSSDYLGLAEGEAAVMSLIGGITTLAWTPPDAPTSVLDVAYATLDTTFNPVNEVKRLRRVFMVTFACAPFVRSDTERTISWTGANDYLDLRTSNLTVISGGGSYNNLVPIDTPNGYDVGLQRTASGGGVLEFTADKPLKRFLGFIHDVAGNAVTISNLTIDGVLVTSTSATFSEATSIRQRIFDVSRWEGRQPKIRFQYAQGSGGVLHAMYTSNYPNPRHQAPFIAAALPANLDVIPTLGSMRARPIIEFTNPTGGAFVITGPDLGDSIRRGCAETKFSVFDIVGPSLGQKITEGMTSMWFEQGPHREEISRTAGKYGAAGDQWPEFQPQFNGTNSPLVWCYPAERGVAISYCPTPGAVQLVAPSLAYPTGFHGDAAPHHDHALFPRRSAFSVMDQYGRAVAATIRYFPAHAHNADC